jgi:hypothetical protein
MICPSGHWPQYASELGYLQRMQSIAGELRPIYGLLTIRPGYDQMCDGE